MAPLYTFYADDFTGATDVLEQLASHALQTVLYLAPPTSQQLAAFPQAQAIGIAGDSRSRSPQWMTENLPSIFSELKQLNAPILHYKVCSTFDSSPTHGSIGRAIELGRELFPSSFVPIVVGAPHLRRYVVFGNLFAAAPDGQIYRIDRHPMRDHPVTPMREADLRIHLHAQTPLPIGLVTLPSIRSGELADDLNKQLAANIPTILFDTADAESSAAVGKLLWSRAQQTPLFSASSSGLTTALLSAMTEQHLLPSPTPPAPRPNSGPLLVVSGSCSAATARQLQYALDHGYQGLPLDPEELLNPNTAAAAQAAAVHSACASLQSGQDTVLYTTLGLPSGGPHGDDLGRVLGSLLRSIVEQSNARRILLCGGDTASHAVQQLGLYALTWLANLQPGAPLCQTHATDPHSPMHHLEIVLKGGQVGTDNFFDIVRDGQP